MPETVTLRKKCLFCGQVHTFELDVPRARRWAEGEYIQNVFPELPAAVRETMISGSCPDCFAKAFPDED